MHDGINKYGRLLTKFLLFNFYFINYESGCKTNNIHTIVKEISIRIKDKKTFDVMDVTQ